MNGKQFETAIRVSTEAALKSGEMTLPEIAGTLLLAAIQADRLCYQHAVAQRLEQERTGLEQTAGGILKPKFVAP
jgi:hypothetical protein